MVKKGKFRPEYAIELLRIADGDLDAARVLLSGGAKRIENVFYMAEQAIEKALKAVVCWHRSEVPFVHSLSALLVSLPEEVTPPFGQEIDELTEFATVRRYEEGRVVFDATEAAAAIALAEKVLEWALSQVKTKAKKRQP